MEKKPWVYKHRLYLSVGQIEDGRLVAVITDGSPQFGHTDIGVLSVRVVQSEVEAVTWFNECGITRPWEKYDQSDSVSSGEFEELLRRKTEQVN